MLWDKCKCAHQWSLSSAELFQFLNRVAEHFQKCIWTLVSSAWLAIFAPFSVVWSAILPRAHKIRLCLLSNFTLIKMPFKKCESRRSLCTPAECPLYLTKVLRRNSIFQHWNIESYNSTTNNYVIWLVQNDLWISQGMMWILSLTTFHIPS